MVNVGSRVKICDAPGYADSEAELMALPVTPDGREMAIVIDDEGETHILPAAHVWSL